MFEGILNFIIVGKDMAFGFVLQFFLFGITSLLISTVIFIPFYLYRHFSEYSKVFEPENRKAFVPICEQTAEFRKIK